MAEHQTVAASDTNIRLAGKQGHATLSEHQDGSDGEENGNRLRMGLS
jgi:hypothetical protein